MIARRRSRRVTPVLPETMLSLLTEFIIVSDFSLARRLAANRTARRSSISRNEILLPAREGVSRNCWETLRKSNEEKCLARFPPSYPSYHVWNLEFYNPLFLVLLKYFGGKKWIHGI